MQCKFDSGAYFKDRQEYHLEYNIICSTIEKTGRKSCCIREQMIGIAMTSERDFGNVTCVWSCNLHAL